MNSKAGKMNGEKIIPGVLQICGNIIMRNAASTVGKCNGFEQNFVVNRTYSSVRSLPFYYRI